MANKEPWLAVNLSNLFPGVGQIYAGDKNRGYAIAATYLALAIIAVGSIFAANGNILVGVGAFILNFCLWLWSLFDAFGAAKSRNSQEFEDERTREKDGWLAFFLSSMFWGIGNFYIGKWLVGILAIILIIIAAAFSPLLVSLVIAFAAFMSYNFSPVKRENLTKIALLIALLMMISSLPAIALRNYMVEARWIPSGAMEPTLHGTPNQSEADRIMVDKFSYKMRSPQRGDIIVFNPTDALLQEKYTDAFIKRIVGIPGEKIELKKGQVYINNQPLSEEKYLAKGQTTAIDLCFSGQQPPFLSKPVTIPADSYVAMGDNRTNSYDSRCWGLIPRKNIIGKVYKRFWPLNRVGSLEL
jgi:signal peptidase I